VKALLCRHVKTKEKRENMEEEQEKKGKRTRNEEDK
jgi:hypothetical protein